MIGRRCRAVVALLGAVMLLCGLAAPLGAQNTRGISGNVFENAGNDLKSDLSDKNSITKQILTVAQKDGLAKSLAGTRFASAGSMAASLSGMISKSALKGAAKTMLKDADLFAGMRRAADLLVHGNDHAATVVAVQTFLESLGSVLINPRNLFTICMAMTAGTGILACGAVSLIAAPILESLVDRYVITPVANAAGDALFPLNKASGGGGGGGGGGGCGFQGHIDASAQSITNAANDNGMAETRIGAAKCGNATINAQVGGSVTTLANGAVGKTEIGAADGSARLNVSVGGEVTTLAKGQNATTLLGTATSENAGRVTGTVSISGSVINKGGNLEIGSVGACKAYRNGQCCVDIHNALCVLNFFPKPADDPCPPRYVDEIGVCYLYSDTSHQIIGR